MLSSMVDAACALALADVHCCGSQARYCVDALDDLRCHARPCAERRQASAGGSDNGSARYWPAHTGRDAGRQGARFRFNGINVLASQFRTRRAYCRVDQRKELDLTFVPSLSDTVNGQPSLVGQLKMHRLAGFFCRTVTRSIAQLLGATSSNEAWGGNVGFFPSSVRRRTKARRPWGKPMGQARSAHSACTQKAQGCLVASGVEKRAGRGRQSAMWPARAVSSPGAWRVL